MPAYPEDYTKRVLMDLDNNGGLYSPVKAGVLERIITKKVSVDKIHPNPADEFSDPKIGPSFEIIGNYEKRFVITRNIKKDEFDDPLMVEKLANGEYMLLNGHHRWFAAIRTGIKYAPVQLVNVISEDNIYETIKNTNSRMCVSFDFDEVLLTDGNIVPYDKKLIWPFSKLYKKSLRNNVGVLVNELRAMGVDVWIYSGEFYSEEYIKLLFTLHGSKVDGIINGLSKMKTRKKIQKAFADKYELSLHIDNESIMCVETGTKEYEVIDLKSDAKSWASEVMLHLKEVEMIKKIVDSGTGK